MKRTPCPHSRGARPQYAARRAYADAASIREKNWQAFAHKSGIALTGHINDAHGGKVSDTCPACKELQEKVRSA